MSSKEEFSFQPWQSYILRKFFPFAWSKCIKNLFFLFPFMGTENCPVVQLNYLFSFLFQVPVVSWAILRNSPSLIWEHITDLIWPHFKNPCNLRSWKKDASEKNRVFRGPFLGFFSSSEAEGSPMSHRKFLFFLFKKSCLSIGLEKREEDPTSLFSLIFSFFKSL